MTITNISQEEYLSCMELIEKMRIERRRQEKIEEMKKVISEVVSASINAIGLDETKKIIREINRELRS